jgi:hypothetical protein
VYSLRFFLFCFSSLPPPVSLILPPSNDLFVNGKRIGGLQARGGKKQCFEALGGRGIPRQTDFSRGKERSCTNSHDTRDVPLSYPELKCPSLSPRNGVVTTLQVPRTGTSSLNVHGEFDRLFVLRCLPFGDRRPRNTIEDKEPSDFHPV